MEVNFMRELLIGLEMIEIAVALFLFFYFLSKAFSAKGDKEKLKISLVMGLTMLLLAFSRVFSVAYSYYVDTPWVLHTSNALMWIGAFLLIILISKPIAGMVWKKSWQFPAYIATGLVIFAFIYGIYAIQDVLPEWTNIITNIYVTGVIVLIYISPFFYAGILFYRKVGGIIKRQFMIGILGLISLFIGTIFQSFSHHSLGGIPRMCGILTMIFGLIVIGVGFWGLPSLKELDWKKKIMWLCLSTTGGVLIFDYSFMQKNVEKKFLIASAVSGIISLVEEMTDSDKRLNSIKQEGKNILIEYGQYVVATLVAEEDLLILHQKLNDLLSEFELLYSDVLTHWNGKLNVFSPAKVLVERIFID